MEEAAAMVRTLMESIAVLKSADKDGHFGNKTT